jgi:eukaryotic-like serine/threonine-protein kinase
MRYEGASSTEQGKAQRGKPNAGPANLIRSDAKGQCPGRKQVPLNEGCWVELLGPGAQECEQNGYVLIRERCYAPALEARREPPPTSDQPR